MPARAAVNEGRRRKGRPLRAPLIASFAWLAAAGLARAAASDAPTSLGALGTWALDLDRSSFDEELLGPKPAKERIVVTRDDGRVLAFRVELTRQDGGREVETVSAPLDQPEGDKREGGGRANAIPLQAHLARLDPDTLEATLSMANGASNKVIVNRLQPDVLMLQEDMVTIDGDRVRQTLYFDRVEPAK